LSCRSLGLASRRKRRASRELSRTIPRHKQSAIENATVQIAQITRDDRTAQETYPEAGHATVGHRAARRVSQPSATVPTIEAVRSRQRDRQNPPSAPQGRRVRIRGRSWRISLAAPEVSSRHPPPVAAKETPWPEVAGEREPARARCKGGETHPRLGQVATQTPGEIPPAANRPVTTASIPPPPLRPGPASPPQQGSFENILGVKLFSAIARDSS